MLLRNTFSAVGAAGGALAGGKCGSTRQEALNRHRSFAQQKNPEKKSNKLILICWEDVLTKQAQFRAQFTLTEDKKDKNITQGLI